MRILVVIPAYNEQENIIKCINDIEKNAPYVDYVIINDCSTDNTKPILKNEGKNYLDLPVNLGIGGGVQTGYLYAKESGYDIAVQFDGDGQHDASCIEKLIAPIINNEADMVIGSRFLEKNGFQSTGARRAGIKFLSFLIKAVTRLKIYDVTSGFRAVNRKMIEIFSNHYEQDYPEPEAIVAASVFKCRVIEVPIIMHERTGGESSISPLKSVYYMIKVSIAIILYRSTFKRKRQ